MEDSTYSRLVIGVALVTILVFPIALIIAIHSRSPPDYVPEKTKSQNSSFPWNAIGISREHTGIWLDFPVLYTNHSFTTDDWEDLVQEISTKFGTIVIDPPIFDNYSSYNRSSTIPSHLRVVEYASKHNLRSVEQKQKDLMEVIISFDNTSTRTCNDTAIFNIHIAKHAACFANKRFPGTVPTLLYNPGHDEAQLLSMESRTWVETAREALTNWTRPSQLKIGVLIDVMECLNKSNAIVLHDVVSVTDVVFVRTRFGSNRSTIGSRRILSESKHFKDDSRMKVLEKLTACESKLKRIKKNIEVVGSVTCSRNSEGGNYLNREEGLAYLIKCWSLVSDWAKHGRKVVMHSAWELWLEEDMDNDDEDQSV